MHGIYQKEEWHLAYHTITCVSQSIIIICCCMTKAPVKLKWHVKIKPIALQWLLSYASGDIGQVVTEKILFNIFGVKYLSCSKDIFGLIIPHNRILSRHSLTIMLHLFKNGNIFVGRKKLCYNNKTFAIMVNSNVHRNFVLLQNTCIDTGDTGMKPVGDCQLYGVLLTGQL